MRSGAGCQLRVSETVSCQGRSHSHSEEQTDTALDRGLVELTRCEGNGDQATSKHQDRHSILLAAAPLDSISIIDTYCEAAALTGGAPQPKYEVTETSYLVCLGAKQRYSHLSFDSSFKLGTK